MNNIPQNEIISPAVFFGGSIYEPKVFLQDNRVKPSPGAIWIDVKVWDLFKYIINQVKVSLFDAFL